MNLEDLTDEDIIAEVRKLQYLYGLKREIRYGQKRGSDDSTESVAEHIYGMHLLAHYFLSFEDKDNTWDRAKIFSMITFHDIDEIETGDIIGYRKTAAQQAAEAAAMHTVKDKAPENLQEGLTTYINEYEERTTDEALFVRAIDKFEPLVHLYNELGREILHREECTIDNSRSIKDEHVKHFPSIKRFTDVMHERMISEGYFFTASSRIAP
jgi:5'-deoxynucleotidase YfbR-like HD superfamily hydrolase